MKAIQEKIRKHLPAFVLCMLFCIAVYSHLMTEELVNPIDAIWHYSYHRGSTWEISNGRWLWYYITQLRFGICTDPLTSLISLACFSAGCVALLELFSVRRKITACLACALFLGNVVVCDEISYRFMSPTFALAFLLSILAAMVMIRGRRPAIAILGGGVLIAMSMGLYQAYLGATCIAVLGWFLWALLREEMSYRELGRIAVRCVAGFCLGGALYLVAVKIHLRLWHIELADRAASYSLMNTIKQFPQSFAKTYSDFFQYFAGKEVALNAFRRANLPAIAIIFAGGGAWLATITVLVSQRDWRRAILLAALLLLVPAACNAVLLLATEVHTSIQMTGAMALCIPVLLCALDSLEFSTRWKKAACGVICLVLAATLYGNIWQVELDQFALSSGQTATVTMANEVLHSLNDAGYLNAEVPICIVGTPRKNPLFRVADKMYERANNYAKFGSSFIGKSWNGVFNHLCGVDLNICTESEENAEIAADPAVKAMPLFPAEGSIVKNADGIVVVKIADIDAQA